ncbi:unnamed protein product [[Candida] boidinii]|uniref:Cystathionine beta-lyase n=1 Tax=Candida boidinii TaxID=5477 RepID=A0A9W6T3E8_CANBO|nr:hypothetical protein BVG19_g990 [[Candida] boidinii]OWB50545.1 hypothetical protein B5S27_g2096 [[Candida] boidinii]OWB65254.1 hypothetical protein B5S30_g578 [[Candida] boidinii]OWB83032.1 hypothetical protein B5S33_g1661 [[Candida] boidinii]GME73201.1 unnamed protein product [[Candida] boidinii]
MAPEQSKKVWSLETEVTRIQHNDSHHSSIAPLYQSATFKQTSLSDMGEYDYTRSGNPTRTTLQNHLQKIMKAEYVYAVNSGMAALDVITRSLKPGDEVLAGEDLYGGTHRLLTYLNNKGDLKVSHYDTTNLELIKSKITKDIKMIFLESPTNPLIKVIDLKEITDYAHKVNPDLIVVFDNTMMSPILMTPLELGVDIHYESGTKYLNGHHDIMAGVIATNKKELADKIFYVINATGSGLAPFDSWLMMRGLKTLALRVERQQESALKIAEWLESKKFKVRYPGLKSHSQYELHKSYSKGFGGVLSFETGDVDISSKIVENCEIFGVTVSFGCVNSLISLPCKMSHASIDEKTRKERDFPEDLIRLCIGIENCNDLIEDLENALKIAGAL